MLVGASDSLAALLAPLRVTLLGVPPVGLVVIVSIWLGVSGTVAVLVVVILTAPAIAHATAAGVRAVEPAWLEMARAFGVPAWRRLRYIVAPAVVSPVIAAATVAAAAAFRGVVMAELLAAGDGVGSRIGLARANLDTAQVFAWCLIAIGVAVLLELLLLAPVRHRALRWTRTDTPAPHAPTPGLASAWRWALRTSRRGGAGSGTGDQETTTEHTTRSA
ncbi:ABC transporter permease subunit [Micromonospora sp. CPCC 206060]|uniref:ABC transporter permease n=1 Tax=Micromonospora sp. CPCC 206060 TaxID=3122406 RepID=UPI002FF007E1